MELKQLFKMKIKTQCNAIFSIEMIRVGDGVWVRVGDDETTQLFTTFVSACTSLLINHIMFNMQRVRLPIVKRSPAYFPM